MTSTDTIAGVDRRVALIFGTALLCLYGARFGIQLSPASPPSLAYMCWWSGTQIFCYLVVPLVFLTVTRGSLADIGWKFRGTSSHWRVYLGLFAIAVPFVVWASFSQDFQLRYPLYDVVVGQTGVWGDLAVWWPFYFAQFIAVESFFRGFLVLGLAPRFGSSAVLIATVPYLMIHFVKPPAEALASIVGGIVMGTLALRTRSVWWGIGLHVSVAALMDVLALGHKGFIW